MMPDYNNWLLRTTALFINAIGFVLFFWIFPKKIDKEKIKSILITKFDRIGDTFLATPTIEALRKLFPHVRIIFLAALWNKDILLENPNIDELKICEHAPNVQKESMLGFLNKERISNLKNEIKKISPDIIVDLQGNPLNVIAGFLARVPVRVGFKRKLLSFLLNKRASYPNVIHQSEIYFSIAKSLGFKGEMPKSKIFITREIEEKIRKILKNNNLKDFLVFHLGSGRSYRQWPTDYFISLAKKLLSQKPDRKIAIIGSRDDLHLVNHLLDKIKVGIVNLVGVLDVREAYSLMSFARGFVGNESAPAHLAGSLGIPTIMFMNEWSGINRWKALGERVYILKGEKRHRCAGIKCTKNPCPNMASISVEEAFKIAKNF